MPFDKLSALMAGCRGKIIIMLLCRQLSQIPLHKFALSSIIRVNYSDFVLPFTALKSIGLTRYFAQIHNYLNSAYFINDQPPTAVCTGRDLL